MAKIFVGDIFEALDDERIALRVKVAMLKEQGANQAEFLPASERLRELDGQLRTIIAEGLCKVGQRATPRRQARKPAV